MILGDKNGLFPSLNIFPEDMTFKELFETAQKDFVKGAFRQEFRLIPYIRYPEGMTQLTDAELVMLFSNGWEL